MKEEAVSSHLTDAELYILAVPPVGEPEALPRHLSECLPCSRALQEWKSAVRELARNEVEPLDRRSPEEWTALEDKTMEALRRAARPNGGKAVKWAISIAASLLLAALLIPKRPSIRVTTLQAAGTGLSAQDQKDDALLRDVARLSRGEDGGPWNGLAPEPGTIEEEQL